MIELTEIRKKSICKCEDKFCNYYPLKHFEECPKCGSKAFHTEVISGEIEEQEKEVKKK